MNALVLKRSDDGSGAEIELVLDESDPQMAAFARHLKNLIYKLEELAEEEAK